MVSLTRLLSGVCLACTAAAGAPWLRDVPVFFEPNAGQWDSRVQFRARAGDYPLWLTRQGAVVGLPRPVEISLDGSNPAARITGVDPLASRSNYLLGNRQENWRTGVVHYSRVRYAEIYPGIDVIYYGNQRQLEYDLVLEPGADPGRIRMKFHGGTLSLTPQGDLRVQSGDASLIQKRPLVYQQSRKQISGRYKLLGNNAVGVELGRYDRSQPLTIDPVLSYSTLVGSTGTDAVTSVKVDQAGNIYIAGYVGAGDLTSSDQSFQGNSGGGTDAFVAKINPNYAGPSGLVFLTYLGGSGNDQANDMVIDAAGNIYVTGSTASTDFPTGGNAPKTASGGGTDAFVAVLKPSAQGSDQLIFSTYLGGGDTDVGNAIAIDKAGAIYVAGTTKSGDFPLSASAYQTSQWGPQDAFVAKMDPNAAPSLVYSTYFGGDSFDDGRAIAVTPDGATVYLAGSTLSAQFPLKGFTYQPNLNGGVDIFLAQMDLTRSGEDSLLYATYFGGSGAEEVRKILLDASGKLLMTGYTLSTDFPVTSDALQSTLAGNADVFITQVDFTAPRSAFVTYSTFLGGSGGEVAHDMALDTAGNVYLTGYTLSGDFPITGDALQALWGGGVNIFLTKLNPAKGLLYSSYLGATGVHQGFTVAAGADGTIYVGGMTGLHNIPVTDSAMQNVFAGGLSDGFVLALKPDAAGGQ